MKSLAALAHIAGAFVLAAACSGKVTASDSRTVESFQVASGTVELKSSFKAGISKPSSSGKWGLGSVSPGQPVASHIGELVIATDRHSKTVYLCGDSWSGWDFPGLEEKALLARLEEVAAASFRDRRPELEHCVHESPGRTLLVARCRVGPDESFGAWQVIGIVPDREHGIQSSIGLHRHSALSCEEMLAEQTGGG